MFQSEITRSNIIVLYLQAKRHYSHDSQSHRSHRGDNNPQSAEADGSVISFADICS